MRCDQHLIGCSEDSSHPVSSFSVKRFTKFPQIVSLLIYNPMKQTCPEARMSAHISARISARISERSVRSGSILLFSGFHCI
ncbi:MAG: hypothetical protein B6245_13025 [Desulfobacteraceae bacterium 4572_88]|nr:MAG: hypothetical protein B6245_13025 [Desulfobacteraceae bacterium 4572_88]